MTDPRPEDRGPGADQEGPPGLPRWVKVAAIVVGLLLLLFLVLQLTGVGGQHGPGMHSSSGLSPATAGTASPAADR